MVIKAPRQPTRWCEPPGSVHRMARRKTLRLENLEVRQLLAADVMITEFMAKNDGFLQDGQNKSPDWIELFNAGDEAADLQGFRLTDDQADPSKWAFPSKVLDPGQYLVVFASGNDVVDEEGYLHTNFSLRASGEYLGLISPDGEVISQFGTTNVVFPAHRSNVSYGVSASVTVFDTYTDVFYKVPVDNSDDADWTSRDFDEADRGFTVGKAALGTENRVFFRENLFNEIITTLPEDSAAVYARIHFEVDNPDLVRQLVLDMKYDNGFVAYLNGHMVAADNAPVDPEWSSSALEERPSDGDAVIFTPFDLSSQLDKLVDGDNVIALHGLNHLEDEGDMLMAVQLRGNVPSSTAIGYMPVPTPGSSNRDAFKGFAEVPEFSVTRGFYDSAQIVDITAATPDAEIYYTTDGSQPRKDDPVSILYTEPITIEQLTTLRAAVFKDGYVPSRAETQTYVFVDDVISHPRMNKAMTEHAVWGPQVRDSLLSVPTMSIVTGTEIKEDTVLQEIPISIEFMMPDGSSEFQMNTGLEHFGGGALAAAKKSMRVSFKSIYGQPRLEHDLFGDGAVTEFDQLLLRAGSQDNSSWRSGSYLKNRWAFDRQLEMGQLAPHGRFVQVYINGQYWGMHHLMERPNAAFMASYLGGDKEDYESINRGGLVDGDGSQWEDLKAKAVEADYEVVKNLLDEVNYADYMLLMLYAGNNWDWGPEANWMAATDPPGGEGYKFFAWDSDMILRNSVTADITDNGGPGDFWNSIRQHEEFRMLFADRAQRHLFDDGILTRDRVLAQFDGLEDQVRLPLVAEIARWSGASYTPDNWQANMESVRDYVGRRTEFLVEQLRNADVLPKFEAPTVLVDGERRLGGPIPVHHQVELASSTGTIYYTLDGSDPWLAGGRIAPNAIGYDGAFVLQPDQVVKARILHNDQWSPLRQAEFAVSDLWITELNYHPHDVLISDDELPETNAFEFIEVMNVGSEQVELEGVRLSEAVRFTFDQQTLESGERIVVVEDVDAFRTRYGSEVRVALGDDGEGGRDGEFGGRLANEGELIRLEDSLGRTIEQFTYGDSDLWPALSQGQGGSLQIIDVLRNAGDPHNWRHSNQVGGSPGFADLPAHEVVINEVLAQPRLDEAVLVELYNPIGRPLEIGGWYISDTSEDLFRFQIDQGTTTDANGYHVIDQQQLGSHFDIRGGELWLTKVDSDGRPVRFMDHVQFGIVPQGVSVGRWPTSDDPLIGMAELTFGDPNSQPWVGPIIITEVHTNPVDADGEGTAVKADDSEFVEVYNRGDTPVDLSSWRLDGDVWYTFRPETTLQPGESLVVAAASFRDRAVLRDFFNMAPETQLWGPLFPDLRDRTGTVRLEQPLALPPEASGPNSRLIVDEVTYDSTPPWPSPIQGDSFARTQGDAYGLLPASWKKDSPSPGMVDFSLTLPGDVSNDNTVDAKDIDMLFREVASGTHRSGYDLNQDARVDSGDVDELVLNILQTQFGDANLDRRVDLKDFNLLATNFGSVGDATWSMGDFDGDNIVSFRDFVQMTNRINLG